LDYFVPLTDQPDVVCSANVICEEEQASDLAKTCQRRSRAPGTKNVQKGSHSVVRILSARWSENDALKNLFVSLLKNPRELWGEMLRCAIM
jgi:hypothetical protein